MLISKAWTTYARIAPRKNSLHRKKSFVNLPCFLIESKIPPTRYTLTRTKIHTWESRRKSSVTMANLKATKKFQHRHLKDVLKKRQEIKKVKQKQVLRDKRKSRSREDNGEEETTKVVDNDPKGKALKDMSVDEFFQSGFDIPERPNKKRKRPSAVADKPAKKAATATNGDAEEEEEDDDVEEDDEELSSGNEEIEGGGVMEAEDEVESGSDIEDDEEHKKTLESLAKNDPEFYKFLKDNDAELLDFEDDDLAGLQLSDDEEAPKRKKKTDEDESGKEEDEDEDEELLDMKNLLTIETLNKWEQSVTESKSLRSAREVVLAFRAAVHLNENNGKNYKYVITTSDGKLTPHIR
jgi:nucleolar complex protein 2